MAKPLILSYAADSDTGLVRSENQDSYTKFPADNSDLAFPGGQLFAVADGMGGHRGGKQASTIAVETLQEFFRISAHNEIPDRLTRAFDHANQRILQEAGEDAGLAGMGTTCTALVLSDDKAHICHVGDSRLYRIRKAGVEQLTTDHSQVAEMQRQGIITKEEARNHPYRSVITRALGAAETLEVDMLPAITIADGDFFLLCTDGLNEVTSEEMFTIVHSSSLNTVCPKLINLANQRGGLDNVSVIVVQIGGETQPGTGIRSFFRGEKRGKKPPGHSET